MPVYIIAEQITAITISIVAVYLDKDACENHLNWAKKLMPHAYTRLTVIEKEIVK